MPQQQAERKELEKFQSFLKQVTNKQQPGTMTPSEVQEVEQKLDHIKRQKYTLWGSHIYFVFRMYWNVRNLNEASTWFDMKEDPNMDMYSKLIDVNLCSGKVDEAAARLEVAIKRLGQADREEKGFEAGPHMFYKVIQALIGEEKFERAKALLERSVKALLERSCKIEPMLKVFNNVILAYGKKGKPDEARSTFYCMKNLGLRPDTISYNNLMGAFEKQEPTSDVVLGLFEEMKKEHVRADPYTVGCVMRVLLASDRADEASSLCSKHDAWTDINSQADANHYANTGEFLKVRELILKAPAVTVDHVNVLIKAYTNSQCPDRCTEAEFQLRMFFSHVNFDIVTYNSMIHLSAIEFKPEGAKKWFDKMQAAGLEPDGYSYNTLIDAYARMRQTKSAWECFEIMRAAGVSRSQTTYNTMVKCVDKKHSGFQILSLMGQDGIVTDISTVNTFVELFDQEGLPECAEHMLTRAEDKNIYKLKRKQGGVTVADFHFMTRLVAKTALNKILKEMMLFDGGGCVTMSFSPDEDLTIDCGVSGHDLKDEVVRLLEEKRLSYLEGQFLVVKSESLQQFLQVSRATGGGEFEVKNTFLNIVPLLMPAKSVAHSTTDADSVTHSRKPQNHRRRIPQ